MLALIDRNFQGFGKELFTDAGKYVIHFGQEPQEAAEQVQLPSCSLLTVQGGFLSDAYSQPSSSGFVSTLQKVCG